MHRTGSNVQQGTFHLPQPPAPTAPRRQCHLSAGSRAGSSTAKHRPQLLRSLSTTTCGCHAHGRLHSRTDGVHRQAARAEQQCWWDARCLLLHPHHSTQLLLSDKALLHQLRSSILSSQSLCTAAYIHCCHTSPSWHFSLRDIGGLKHRYSRPLWELSEMPARQKQDSDRSTHEADIQHQGCKQTPTPQPKQHFWNEMDFNNTYRSALRLLLQVGSSGTEGERLEDGVPGTAWGLH